MNTRLPVISAMAYDAGGISVSTSDTVILSGNFVLPEGGTVTLQTGIHLTDYPVWAKKFHGDTRFPGDSCITYATYEGWVSNSYYLFVLKTKGTDVNSAIEHHTRLVEAMTEEGVLALGKPIITAKGRFLGFIAVLLNHLFSTNAFEIVIKAE